VARIDDELARLRDIIDGGRLADGRGLVGVEVEFQLIDDTGRPAARNDAVLAAIADGPHDLQTELGRFNVELNLPPVALDAAPLTSISRGIDDARIALSSAVADTSAVTIGTLPTLGHDDVGASIISARGRYHELDANIMAARDGAIDIDIDGTDACGDRLEVTVHSVVLEAAATSLQIHLDLPADGLVPAWNVAQAVAALQVAVSANSPLLLGRALWHETRIPLFEQLIDIRSPTERDPTVNGAIPPRVWFGDRWITHPADPFAENLARFRRPLIDSHASEDDALALSALTVHNSTVWRWNRPVYAVIGGRPTLRIENRVLSAPPSSADGAADVALFAGLVAGLRDDADGLTARMPFTDAAANFRAAARHGLGARLRWPGITGGALACDLLADGLIEVASDGLDALGVAGSESGPALDVIAGRASEGRNGTTWQLATLAYEEQRHDRATALHRMLLRYRDLQAEGGPVHRWPVPSALPIASPRTTA